MRNVRTCAKTVDRPRPILGLKETMVNTDKNQINFGHSWEAFSSDTGIL
jgi:hypothetical protein